MEKFSLQHTVLYSKGWYKRLNNRTVWEDLQILLEKDGYTMWEEKPNKKRIVYLILGQMKRLNLKAFDLQEFYEGIQEYECWKTGYYTKGNCDMRDKSNYPDYDVDEATLKYCISSLCNLDKDKWDVIPPDYKNVLPRNNNISNESLRKCFGNV